MLILAQVATEAATVIVPLVVGVVLLLVLLSFLRGIWKVAPPNQALIISGMGGGKEGREFKIVTGGGAFVFPGLQQASRLSLNLREAQLSVKCVTKQGIPVVISGVCIYKIADDPVSITNAARRFLDQPEEAMDTNIQNVFDGHLRSIIGALTVEQLISDRVALTDGTRDAAKMEVEKLGLVIDSLQIKDIGDPTNYIANLAKPHIAAVEQAARVAQAAADQAATIAEQEATAKKAEAASLSGIKQAEYAANTERAKAEAAQSGPLASAKAQQQVIVEQTKMAELEAARKEQELQTTVRKPADAEAYRLQREAEGQRAATIAQAEAQATAVKLCAAADAEAATLTGEASGKATTARGLAEAEVAKAKLIAEADGLKARADALATNQEAVISTKIAELLPAIVAEAAKPFAAIKNLTVLDGAAGLGGMLGNIVKSASALMPIAREGLASLRSAKDEPEEK
jgi:uncharacterized membrane protein YqiK